MKTEIRDFCRKSLISISTINVQNYFQLISNYTIQMQKEKTLTQILV